MAEVTIRELRNHGGDVVDRVARGEHVTITRSGKPVAELSPPRPTAQPADRLLARWKLLPHVDPERLRSHIDAALGRTPVTERVQQGLLDTRPVILLGRLVDTSGLPEEPLITAVTLAELSVGPLVATDDRERPARQAHLQQAESDFDPLPFDASAARAFGQVAASIAP